MRFTIPYMISKASFSIGTLLSGRRLAVYGGKFAFHQLRKTFPGIDPELVIDDDLGKSGVKIDGTAVATSDNLPPITPDKWFVIICAYVNTAVCAIRSKLLKRGFSFPADMIDSSILHWKTMAPKLSCELEIIPDDELFWNVHSLAMEIPLPNATSIAGTSLAAHLIQHAASSLRGDICEFGAYQGGNAFIISLLLRSALSERQYHILDSFEGLQSCGAFDPKNRTGEFADVEWKNVQHRFAFIRPVRLWRGFFSETLPNFSCERISFAYIDCDLYEPAVQCLNFIRPHLEPGGIILLHDYVPEDWKYPEYVREPFRGIAKAVEEFCSVHRSRLVVFPETTHAVVLPQS